MGLRGRHLGSADQRGSRVRQRGNVPGSSYGDGPRHGRVRRGHGGREGYERAPRRGRGPPVPRWGPRYTWFDDRGPDLARHSVALLVADDDGASSTATTNVTVVNVPPRVGITGVWWFSDKILFEGTAFDPGADDLTFIWKVGGVSGSDWYRSTSFANGLHPREQVAYASYPTGPRLNALLPLTFALVVNDDEGAGGFDTVTLVSSKTSAFPAPLCAIPRDVAVQCALPPRDDRLVDGLAPRFDAGPAVTVSEEAVSPTFAPSSFADSSSASWTLVWEWGDGSVTQLNG